MAIGKVAIKKPVREVPEAHYGSAAKRNIAIAKEVEKLQPGEWLPVEFEDKRAATAWAGMITYNRHFWDTIRKVRGNTCFITKKDQPDEALQAPE